ncbi:alpha/beta fold hydrolase [Nonomuraea sp. NPDC050536]|uniref:alpha/beta fold hydrolase n=1 Tax=Nonomuraea sp. NPDC050536 TaxID=3364366 RepID=UPI0037C8CD69
MTAVSPTEPNPAAHTTDNLTFVLVHGAFQTGKMWNATASELRRDGHIVHTPTLAGHGPGEPMTLSHTDAVASLTAYLHDHDLSDIVLVGHSIGGAYIAQAAEQAPERIKRLVFLSAFVPSAGHALADEFPPADAAFFDMADPAQGFLLPFPVIRERACNDMDSAAAEAVYAEMSPIPVRYFTDKLDLGTFHALVASGGLQASYVNPVSDYALPPGDYASFPRFAVRLGPLARILQIPGSHYVMLSRPAELADTLVLAGCD